MAINFNYSYNYPQVARESGFKLRQHKDGPLDWRLLGSLDLERLQREQHFEQVDGVLTHLAEVPLAGMLETNILDSGIAKYFLLTQYAVQYLLFVRKFLDETIGDLRDAYAASQTEVARLRQQRVEANNEILQLHKKITQIEAIHEVVYPCAHCTKSFVSNEALNIHIGRKHPNTAASNSASNNNSGSKRANDKTADDMNLINTIKLELEIKQLKERLNVAEREIRERSVANSKRPTPRDEPTATEEGRPHAVKAMKSIGIQSNLTEEKERDDTSHSAVATIAEDASEATLEVREEQLVGLQQKVLEFDEWRERLRHSNDASIAEINKKLGALTLALDREQAPSPLQGAAMANLEQVLMDKVSEIGQASAVKLEEVVQHMEANYKAKLEQLEREINRRKSVERGMEISGAAATGKKTLQRTQTVVKALSTESSESAVDASPPAAETSRRSTRTEITVVEAVIPETRPTKAKDDDTFEIVVLPPTNQPKEQQIEPKEPLIVAEQKERDLALGSLSTDESSNQTFVKAGQAKRNTVKVVNAVQEGQSTDVSESLEDETASDSETTADDEEPQKGVAVQQELAEKAHERPKTAARGAKADSSATLKPRKIASQVKPFTRQDAKRLTQRQLQQLGLEAGTRSLTSAMLKRSVNQLVEERTKLRQKHPNFYATRNKLKKFVDKLCSAKLPPKAEAVLKATSKWESASAGPAKGESNDENDGSFEEAKASTPRDDFKQRLESILASPIRRPPGADEIADVRDERQHEKTFTVNVPVARQLPVPVPRKRVMFDTASGELRRSGFQF